MSRPSIPPQDAVGSTASTGSSVRSLAHPLPSGMRDLLPAEAEAQGKLASGALKVFELHGYQQVTVPAFEYADVLERGLGNIEQTSVLRFVEPETGEVVALRPDMTPQLARLVATRLADRPVPARLSYRGSVLQRKHQRARHDQEALQVGVELVGVGGARSDLEVIRVCVAAVRNAGLESFVLDLGHGGIAVSLVEEFDEAVRAELIESLSLKDGAELARRASAAGLSEKQTKTLVSLVSLQGGAEVFDRAKDVLGDSPAWPHVLELKELYDAIQQSEVAAQVVVDLGETRAAEYYTGPTFQVLAEGPGQAVAQGGRYDALYGVFGAPRPAAGGGIQLDHLRWALKDRLVEQKERILVAADDAAAAPAFAALREAGIPCVSVTPEAALDYARAWRYSHIARPEGSDFRVFKVGPQEEVDLGQASVDQLPQKIRS